MTQILFILLLVLLLFMGPTLIRRWRGVLSDRGEDGSPNRSERAGKSADDRRVQDLVACETCGTYGPRPAPTCDRPDCPGR